MSETKDLGAVLGMVLTSRGWEELGTTTRDDEIMRHWGWWPSAPAGSATVPTIISTVEDGTTYVLPSGSRAVRHYGSDELDRLDKDLEEIETWGVPDE